jgi:hypothetical protein
MDEYREVERGHYNALVDDGGRPCYPIALLEQVSENPKEHRTILRPFQDSPDDSWPRWEVFGRQLGRWEDFRRWQLVNRDMYDPDSAYLAFVEKKKRMRVAEGETEELAVLNDNPSHLMPLWEDKECERNRDYKHLWWVEGWKPTGAEEGGGVFSVYVDKVMYRLAQHGFTRAFQLEKDPKQQDKLTTWIEYLNYEYAWYDRYAQNVKRLQPPRDEGWKRLVASGVLRPLETEEYLFTDEASRRRQSEWNEGRRAVQSAEAAAEAALAETEKAKTGRSRLSVQERKRRLAAAHSRVVAAKEAWKPIKRRHVLIGEFMRGIHEYLLAKDDVYCQGVLLQWILAQVPLIEAELNETKVADAPARERTANTASSTRRADDTTRKTRGGRIAKNAPPRPPDRRRGPSRADVLEDIGDDTRTARQPRNRQRKTCEKGRASRRLAGKTPEFAGLGEAPPLPDASLQQAWETGTPPVPRSSSRRSRKPAVIKGGKPGGISKAKAGRAKLRRTPRSAAV